MAPNNNISYDELDAARLEGVMKVIDTREEIVAFVGVRLNWKEPAGFIDWHKGSFNVCAQVQRGDSDEQVLIRFPRPGVYGPWRAEKVANEAAVLRYLHEHTNIPVPRVLDVGAESESPQQLGPFLIMEFRGRWITEPSPASAPMLGNFRRDISSKKPAICS